MRVVATGIVNRSKPSCYITSIAMNVDPNVVDFRTAWCRSLLKARLSLRFVESISVSRWLDDGGSTSDIRRRQPNNSNSEVIVTQRLSSVSREL